MCRTLPIRIFALLRILGFKGCKVEKVAIAGEMWFDKNLAAAESRRAKQSREVGVSHIVCK